MRTTVTIDDDVAQRLRDAMHRRRTNFKEALNTALRRGLANPSDQSAARKRFVVKGPFLGRVQPGIDPAGFNKLADQLEDEAISAKLSRHRRR